MPTKDWRAIGPVTVHRTNGDVSRHDTLAAALTRLSWPEVTRVTDFTPPPGSLSELAPLSAPRGPVLYDELGLRIPAFRVLCEAERIGVEANWRKRTRFCWRGMPLGPFRFRDGPVPGVRHSLRGYSNRMRYMRTRQEAAAAELLVSDEDAIEIGVKPRACRNAANLPNCWDDRPRGDDRSWKKHRRTQWRVRR